MKRFRFVSGFLFVFCLLSPLANGQNLPPGTFLPGVKTFVSFFPYFAVGGGTDYVDGFRLVNGYEFGVVERSLFDSGAQVHLNWFGADGKRFAMKVQTDNDLYDWWAMGSGMSGHASAQNTFSLSSEDIKVGWMQVEISSTESGEPSAEVFLQIRHKTKGQVVGQATVSPIEPSKTFSFYARRYVGSNQGSSETGLALANPYDVAANVTFTRRSRLGNFMDSCIEVIQPMGQLVKFVGQLCKPLDFDYEGSIELNSNVPIVCQALQTTGDGQSFNFSTIPCSTSR